MNGKESLIRVQTGPKCVMTINQSTAGGINSIGIELSGIFNNGHCI